MPLRPPPVVDLVMAAQAGDPRALDRLLRQHWRSIERLCRRMCPADDSFEDLRQDVFIALIRALPSFRGQAAFSTWAYTIVRTCRGRRLRKQRPALEESDRDQLMGSEDEANGAPDEVLVHHELGERLGRAMAGLSSVDQRILVMRDLEGYSAAEVATATGLTVPAVKTRLHRARVAMRGQLQPDA
ncbi:MAG: sigma-70 family RNA polymerase sigma factor [Myxococcales bacterium]|nr:sigma-70 family RNA polymerase sigma factor [Myxococcales bacterium]